MCNGVAQIFLEVEPLSRRRHVEVGKRRTRNDWARFIRGMPEERYAEADCVVLVLENLNMHGIESLYETYPPALALALTERLEIHYTPRHGSWLNIAEIERSALCGQCVNRRIPDRDTMRREIEAWERDRNNGAGSEQPPRQGRLAVQNIRRTRNAEDLVSNLINDTRY